MNKLILHIGHGKTGSSYIQSFLANNILKLKENGINYPKPRDFIKAKKGFITSGNGHRFLNKEGKINYVNFKDKTTLFSEETLFDKLISNEEFVNIINSKFLKVKVILFTRNLFEHEFSVWGQLIKRNKYIYHLDDYFTQNHKSKTYELVKKWIILSEKSNFELKLLNYSNHKNDLINSFLEEIMLNKKTLSDFHIPSQKINRSLNLTELEFIRMINLLDFKKNLAEDLVNYFPNVESSQIFCNQESYQLCLESNLDNINFINSFLDNSEKIKIEPQNEVTRDSDGNSDLNPFLTQSEIKLIINHIIENFQKKQRKRISLNLRNIEKNDFDKLSILITPEDVNRIRDLSLDIAKNSKTLELKDALFLMKIAQRSRPEGKLINQKINEWEKKIKKK